MAKMKTNENQDVKNRILDASEDLFSSKGYDGTSIDQIAKKAEVTKSLIYYYFEGKEKILEELISKHLHDTMKEKKAILSGNPSGTDIIGDSMLKGFDFFAKNKKIMRILIAEMLKDNIRNAHLGEMLKEMITASTASFKELGMDIKDDNEFAMYAFFFGLAPMMTYTLFGDSWIENNQIDKREFAAKFAKMARTAFSNEITGIKDELFEPLNPLLVDSFEKLLDK